MDHNLVFMREAFQEAQAALRENEVPVGAILVTSRGEILSRAHNRSIALNDPTAHAEILALRQGAAELRNYRLEGTTLYVTIEPCVMCAGSLVWARVQRLVYGARDPKGGGVDSLFQIVGDSRLNHRVEVVSGILEGECSGIMQRFFQERRARDVSQES